ncbi:hypothetical protein BpHYR1_049001 [Brachionus plicatilis]|uniref:Uncharacterized protein n=1 Tax=Brachionus plicatilis TaxID=10195 RepID=A0A3M7T6H5_BRAPC|nr:hypothetical protein BpHYR1_049001 [Brachionus plicatilis]
MKYSKEIGKKIATYGYLIAILFTCTINMNSKQKVTTTSLAKENGTSTSTLSTILSSKAKK